MIFKKSSSIPEE
jgi:hypothetical protein